MISEADILCTITCPQAPEDYESAFRLRYHANYKEGGAIRNDVFEKEFRIRKDQSVFVRFSEGSIVQFGRLPMFPAWTNALKRTLSDPHVPSYWGFQICDVMPTMGYSLCRAYTPGNSNLSYSGNQLQLRFDVLLTAIHASSIYFGRGDHFSTYEIKRSAT